MKKILFALATIGLIAIACAAFAQGAFVDVPTDHWAYDAVNQLQRVGIIVGYPDGTFGGKRAMTRYEFAVAIARLLPLLNGETIINNDADLSGYAKKSDIPTFNGAGKGDLDALRKLVGEFGDELASLGVDVDALKRDVAGLTARVEALEAENRRVRFTGDFFVAGIASSGDVIDIDGIRTAHEQLDDVQVLKNFDLNIVGRASDKVTVYSTINYGDYLSYYANAKTDWDDAFYPTYLYAVADMGKTTLTAGRFPMFISPLMMRHTDKDFYTEYKYTDDRNYILDGVKADMNFGKNFDLTLFAAKNDQNRYNLDRFNNSQVPFVPYHNTPFTQMAGARALFGLGKASLGATYYEAWSDTSKLPNTDQLRVYGFDAKVPFGDHFALKGEYGKSKMFDDTHFADISNDSDAWTADLTGQWNKFDFDLGYKRIERNFYSAGAWMAYGQFVNLTGVKGFQASAGWNLSPSFRLGGEYYDYKVIGMPVDLDGYAAELTWKMSSKDSLGFRYENYDVDFPAAMDYNETYQTITYKHAFNPNTSLRLMYQFINDKENLSGLDEHGARAIAQVSVSF